MSVNRPGSPKDPKLDAAPSPAPAKVVAPSAQDQPAAEQPKDWLPGIASATATRDGFEVAPRGRSLPVHRPTGIEGSYFDRLVERMGLSQAVADGVVTEEEANQLGLAFSAFVQGAGADGSIDSYRKLLGVEAARADIQPIPKDKLLDPSQSADYLVIAPRDLQAALMPLLDHRALQGHRVALVDPQDVYALYGEESAAALGRFVSEAHRRWGEPKLRFVNLVGAIGKVPTFWEQGDVKGHGYLKHGSFASDNRYGDPDRKGVPELAVGRLPVQTGEVLSQTISKLIAYEAVDKPGLWQAGAMLADGDPAWGSFVDSAADKFARHEMKDVPADLDVGRASFNPKSPINVPLPTFDKKAEVDWLLGRGPKPKDEAPILNTEVSDAITRGVLYVSYTGHGSTDSADGLNITDSAVLHTNAGSPIVALTACLTGVLDREGLAVDLMQGDAPAVATIGASDVTLPSTNASWSKLLARGVMSGSKGTVGETFRDAKDQLAHNRAGGWSAALETVVDGALSLGRVFGGHGRSRESHLYLYNLMGDPATVIRRPEKLAGVRLDGAARAGASLPLHVELPPDVQEGVAYVSLEKPFGKTLEPMEDVTAPGISERERAERGLRNAHRFNQRSALRVAVPVAGGQLGGEIALPPGIQPGRYQVRVAVVGDQNVAVGSVKNVEVLAPEGAA
jgi:hypothetical protein